MTQGWWRLECLVEDADWASSMLWSHGAQGVEVYDAETFFEIDEWIPVPEGKTRLVAYYELSESDAESMQLELQSTFEDHRTRAEIVDLSPYEDRSWEQSWKRFFRPIELSPRAMVGPPWEDFEAPVDGIGLVIEPGMAFGTGSHETTQLVARRLDAWLAEHPDADVLDVGCGSGILSMLAAGLGARSVRGIDVDAKAIEVARENLETNHYEARVELDTTPLAALSSDFDLVVANILDHILLELAADLRARVRPGGWLLLSGIQSRRLPDLRARFVTDSWSELSCDQQGEWFALTLQRGA